MIRTKGELVTSHRQSPMSAIKLSPATGLRQRNICQLAVKLGYILQSDTKFIDKIGLKEHLTPTRANGLVSMIKQIKIYALAFKNKIN